MFPLEIQTLARLLLEECRDRSLRIVTAESCTGGLVSGALCTIPGASDVLERGFVTYSNRAKQEVLGVPGDLLADHGAVSEPVARAMAEGAERYRMHRPRGAASGPNRRRPCAVRADSASIVPPPCFPHSDHPPAEPAAAAPTTR